eukprot:CAMPEP_0175947286 /NCGR_PEP_ID=MMETSP0108-20121206/27798_1 /TAXON_ID=195067 ORGANISM="Goniomonas pacifica, Strain CCMP1869" /NCGR_SAMPLE_ID=MMETSP0108 /ASSEMBLY_ACC=CAM_ASM_000204 /LENGTH=55 /DNA_ID=CAMNT_0017272893 /DNA_START=37 /DNA_END=201 /DNA_ORIENTATION=-
MALHDAVRDGDVYALDTEGGERVGRRRGYRRAAMMTSARMTQVTQTMGRTAGIAG